MKKLQWTLRYLVPLLAFGLTSLAWWERLALEGGAWTWSTVLYLALQSFLFNAPPVERPPALLTVMMFAAPLSLTAALLSLTSGFTLELKRLGGLCKAWGKRLVLLIGDGWRGSDRSFSPARGTHALAFGDRPPTKHLTSLAYDAVTAARLKRAGARKADRVLAYPADSAELWELLKKLGRAARTARRKVRTTVFTDRCADSEVLNTLSQSQLQAAVPEVEALDLHLIETRRLFAQQMVDRFAPHRHPERKTSLARDGAQVIVDGRGSVSAALAEEILRHLHYPEGRRLRLALGGDAAIPEGIEAVAEVLRMDGSSDAPDLAPQTIFVVADGLDELLERVRSWHRWLWIRQKPAAFVVPILTSPPELAMEPTAVQKFREFGRAAVDLQYYEPMAAAQWVLDYQENHERIARCLHALWNAPEDPSTITGMEAWEELSQADRDMNLRPARHLDLKLWFLGYKLTLAGDSDVDPASLRTARELSQSIKDDPSLEETLMRNEHDRWMAEKIVGGYLPLPMDRVPQDKAELKHLKNDLRIHQDLCAFERLSLDERNKDRTSHQLDLFFQTIRGLRLERETR